MGVCAVVLAAGDGTRMKSRRPKVLCEVACKPMLGWVLSAVRQADIADCCIVCGEDTGAIRAVSGDDAVLVQQHERRGTGHALMQCREYLAGKQGEVVVLCGDAPFFSAMTLRGALDAHRAGGFSATVITAELSDPTGYGRILRGSDGMITGVIEQKDASGTQRAIREINSGAYIYDIGALLSVLNQLTDNNLSKEYYLTDTIGLLTGAKRPVGCFLASPDEVLGANDPETLLHLNELARDKILRQHLQNGVRFPLRDGVLISPDVTIGEGTVIMPGCILTGQTHIGRDCVVGPQTVVEDCTVGDGCVLNASQLRKSTVGDGVRLGPFAQLRPNTHLSNGVKVGNFVEVKNSTIGQKTSVAHLTYIGDSDIGARVNIGCGVVTVNYDGYRKYRTVVKDGAFIGCNTNLVAPVTVGEGAYTAAGTTITEDVPPGTLAIGRARQFNKDGYVDEMRKKNALKSDTDKDQTDRS